MTDHHGPGLDELPVGAAHRVARDLVLGDQFGLTGQGRVRRKLPGMQPGLEIRGDPLVSSQRAGVRMQLTDHTAPLARYYLNQPFVDQQRKGRTCGAAGDSVLLDERQLGRYQRAGQ
jgi:hypothetical protein